MGRMEKGPLKLNPQFVDKDGVRAFAVLPYEEYLALLEYLENVEDMAEMRVAIEEEKNAPTIPWEQAKKELKL
jgi:hypothetical protein